MLPTVLKCTRLQVQCNSYQNPTNRMCIVVILCVSPYFKGIGAVCLLLDYTNYFSK